MKNSDQAIKELIIKGARQAGYRVSNIEIEPIEKTSTQEENARNLQNAINELTILAAKCGYSVNINLKINTL
jgi:hypothetical protein